MKKFWLFSIMLITFMLYWCGNNNIEESQEVFTWLNLTAEEKENIYDLESRESRYDLLEEIMENGKLDYEYSKNEIQDIIAATVKYYIKNSYDNDLLLSYINLKNKIKSDFPQFSDEIDDYFQLPRKDEYYNLPKQKDTFNCYWYKVASFTSDTTDNHKWFTKPNDLVNGEIENNDQNFTVKIKPDDTIEFYSNLTPWDATVYKILRSDINSIVAESFNEWWWLLESLTISKKTWLWIWTKVNYYWMPMRWEIPYWIMTYISCDNVL